MESISDLTSKELLDGLSKYTNTDKEFIQVYNGSDSALDHTFRILLNDGDKVIIPAPNYSQINQTITSLGGVIEYCDIGGLEETIKKKESKGSLYIKSKQSDGICLRYKTISFKISRSVLYSR